MRLNLYASLEHYAEHLWPIWQTLPERLRGASWSTQAGQWWGEPQAGAGDAQRHPGPLLVASHGDAVSVAARGRDLVYVEHGAGQTYEGDPAGVGAAGLSGSTDRVMRRVVMFICPNETVAQRWRDRYQVPAIVVGCPRLDWWHARMVSGDVLGEGGQDAERLLDLDRIEGAERVRPGADRRDAAAGAPGRMVDEPRRVAQGGRPPVPQRGRDVRGWSDVSAPGVRQPGPPHERYAERQPGGVAADGPRQGVQARPPLDTGEHVRDAGRAASVPGVPERTQAVAVTFHWDSSLVPETMTAWPEYDYVLPELAAWCEANGVDLLGHGHPRIWPRIARRWAALGVEPVQHLRDVFDRASVLVADNTSALFEFASLGRPVVVLNSQHYRRHIEHGLRFWSHVPGVQVDQPSELVGEWGAVATTVAALRQGVLLGDESRQAAVAAAYAHTDGHAAERAADAIVRMLEP